MAAPIKQGIDYFPLDTDLDQDDKLGMIIGEYGEKGERLWIKMLAWTYKNEGYYFEWKEDVQLRFLRRYNYCGFSMSFIQEVVPRFIRWGLFDKTVFDAFQILTSNRIQKTWLDATRKRKERQINQNFWIIGVNDAAEAEETKEKAEFTDKRKEKKVNEIKEKEIVIGADAPKHPPKSIETFEKRETDFYNSIAEYKEVYPKETLRAFYDYWREPNKSKSKMKFEQEKTWDLKLRLDRWANNDFNKKNNQQNGTGVQKSWGNNSSRPHDTSKMEPGTRIPL